MLDRLLWRYAERRLRRVLPADRVSAVTGDLLEDFDRRVKRDGRVRARVWLLREVRSMGQSYRTDAGSVGTGPVPRGTVRLSGLLFDLRLAVRSLRRQPALALVIVITVGLAVAVNTALFSIFDGLLFRPLPYPNADRIVYVETPREVLLAMSREDRQARTDALAATPLFAERAYALDDAVLFEDGAKDVEAWNLRPATVTPAVMPLLGIRPIHGRLLTEDDAPPRSGGVPRAMLIGFDLWHARFGGDPAIIDRVVDLPGAILGRQFRVVGILPPNVTYPDAAELWVAGNPPPDGGFNLARLADEVTIDQVQGAFPDLQVVSLRDHMRPDGAFALGVLLAATGLLLLVAWVQVAALLFARTASRARELGVRLAIGAGRWRLIRQFASEGFVVAAASLGLAWVLTPALTASVIRLLPPEMTDGQWLAPDGRALLFSGTVSIVGVVVLSLAPVGIIRRSGPAGLLHAGAFGSISRGAARMRLGLLVAQLAVTATLLYMAGLSTQSLRAVGDVDLGFVPDRVAAIQMPPTTAIGANPQEIRAHLDRQMARAVESLEALAGVPGVEAVGQGPLPFYESVLSSGQAQPLSAAGMESTIPVGTAYIDAGYVDVMGLELIEGRIPSRDELASSGLALVNETLANALAVSGPVVGRLVNITTTSSGETTVAGVVRDFIIDRPDRAPPSMLVRFLRRPGGGYIEVRLAADAPLPGTLEAIRLTLDRVWPDNPSREVMLLSDLVDRAAADYRARAVLLGLIGALCLPLALAGIAGALSYATSQRLREIGIRMALGAEPRDISRRVVGRAFAAVSIGFVAGLGGGVLMGRLMSAYLFGVQPVDGWTTAGAAAVLMVTAWVASIVPARRAARIDPAQALRDGA